MNKDYFTEDELKKFSKYCWKRRGFMPSDKWTDESFRRWTKIRIKEQEKESLKIIEEQKQKNVYEIIDIKNTG